MFLQTPDPSPYDLHLRVLGYDIRVAWTFWLGSAFFGFGLAEGMSRAPGAPGVLILLALGCLCILVSIAIHELGHSLAFSVAGVHSHIVLYHFGGMAIPDHSVRASARGAGTDDGWSSRRSGVRRGPWIDAGIAAAGPAAQLISAALLIAVVRASGYYVDGLWPVSVTLDGFVNDTLFGGEGESVESPVGRALVVFYLYPSIAWAVLNLIPVFPLDGGQICRGVTEAFGGGEAIWLWISVIAGGAAALWGLQHEHWFLAVLFASLVINNYQWLQRSGHV